MRCAALFVLFAQASDWTSIFNGKDLEGWKAVGSAVWKVEDGVLAGGQDGDPKRSGVLHSTAEYADLELTLDFMIDEHGKYNSGIYLRNAPGRAGRSGYQVNIGRGEAGEFCGGVYTDKWLAKGDEKDAIRKKLDWNSLRILIKGNHIEVDLNGTRVSTIDDATPDPKFLPKGVIALQTYGAEGHAGWIKFRHIKIRPAP